MRSFKIATDLFFAVAFFAFFVALFFGFEPSKYLVGAAFLVVALDSIRDALSR
jgi:hypothetical protein